MTGELRERAVWRERVDSRVVVSMGTGMIVAVSMVLLGMEPRLVLVGLVLLLVGTATWLVVDLRTAAVPLVWRDHRATSNLTARPDRRVQVLRTRLRSTSRTRRAPTAAQADGVEHVDEIERTLIDAIDDRLVEEHGVDRLTDPVSAAEVLGPELTRFLADPAARRSMTRQRSLGRTLTLIENL